MAKVLAPLMSFGASGKIANSLVYMTWKGLNTVRQYVVPSNPNTLAQSTQRGYMIAAVAMVHAAEILAVDALDAFDQAGYALWGSIFASPRTWFNQFCKMYFDQHVAGLKAAIFTNVTLTPGVDKVNFKAQFTKEGANDVTAVNIVYGLSKTNLINTAAFTKAELMAGKDIASLVTGTKYFFQVQPTAHIDFIGAYSGIFYAVAG